MLGPFSYFSCILTYMHESSPVINHDSSDVVFDVSTGDVNRAQKSATNGMMEPTSSCHV